MTFTPAELAAAEEAFAVHREGKCPGDCSYCEDLRTSGIASYVAEYIRIQKAKLEQRSTLSPRQQGLPALGMPKRVGGKGKGLKGRVKSPNSRR
jgi:hypothetical protein